MILSSFSAKKASEDQDTVTFDFDTDATLQASDEALIEWILVVDVDAVGVYNTSQVDTRRLRIKVAPDQKPPAGSNIGSRWTASWTQRVQKNQIAVKGTRDNYVFEARLRPNLSLIPTNTQKDSLQINL